MRGNDEITMSINDEGLVSVCNQIHNAGIGSLEWEWDGRFGAALTAIKIEDKLKILDIIKNHLGQQWDSKNIDSAPDNVITANAKYGGLMAGQLIFTQEPNADAFLMALWWPWANGQTISIRFVPVVVGSDDSEAAQTSVKNAFGIE